MPALRCTQCDVRWPLTNEFQKCPQCGTPTGRIADNPDVSRDEAIAACRHRDFDKYVLQCEASKAQVLESIWEMKPYSGERRYAT